MNWFTISLGAGIVMVIVGFIFLFTRSLVEASLWLLVGAGLLCLDFSEKSGEFNDRPTELLAKKIAGVVVLVIAAGLFFFQVGKDLNIF